jgi:tetratricopeptide (TPR) repeat protein
VTLPRFRLDLVGSFRLTAPDGSRVIISSRRSRAMLGMLATARSGERSRQWLQERLWGSRDRSQAQASLRRELANLHPLVNSPECALLRLTHGSVALNLDCVTIDITDRKLLGKVRGDFLEGIDIPGEEAFEDWLREERRVIDDEREAAVAFASSGMDLPPELEAMRGRPSLSIVVERHLLGGEDAAILEGVAESLGERIARLRWLPIIDAPAGALRAEDSASRIRVGRLLSVDYLLQCRFGIRRAFALTLSDGKTGHLLWTQRYELSNPVSAEDVDHVFTEAVAALTTQIEVAQYDRVRRRTLTELGGEELIWRARWHMRRLTREDDAIATQLLAAAADLNPEAPEVIIERGHLAAWQLWVQGADVDAIAALRQKLSVLRDIAPFDARSWLLLGILEMWLRRHDNAGALLRQAIELNPSLSAAYGQLGSCLSLSGDPAAALPKLRAALRLNPLGMQNFHQYGELALAHLMLGDVAAAVAEADNALARRPRYSYAHVVKITALTQAKDGEGVRLAAAALRAARPDYDPSTLDWVPFRDPRWNARLRDAVQTAIKTGPQPKIKRASRGPGAA